MCNILFPDFEIYSKVDQLTREKYSSQLPEELLSFWDTHGFGSMLDGYLKVINPDFYIEFLQQSYFRGKVSVPIFATAMGEIITWEEGQYIGKINYPHGTFDIIGGKFKFFFKDLLDPYYLQTRLTIGTFQEAEKIHGEVLYDECFGYVPLLALGGRDSVESLQKCKLYEHLQLIVSFIGKIGDN